MKVRPTKPEAYDLLHEGILALAQVEANGMRVDEYGLDVTIKKVGNRIKRIEEELREDKFWQKWRKRFGQKAKLSSTEQLGTLLFQDMGYTCTSRTEPTDRYPHGKPKVDTEALEVIDLPFVKQYVKASKLRWLRSNTLYGIKRELVDGFLHPIYNGHLAVSYRFSCEAPNSQNLPVRDEELAKYIRDHFIPRGPKRRIVETDAKGIEVGVATCYHKDPTMLQYIRTDPGRMHTDMALKCFCLTEEELGNTDVNPGKKVRYVAKNMYVFPEFYGSYYVDCARNMWLACDKFGLRTANGVLLRDVLVKHGITALGKCDCEEAPKKGTFEHHIAKVEKHFWEVRFPVYAQWKDDWYEDYLRRGGFSTLTGFWIEGDLRRNQVINYPVQGSAFHCLLWVLIRLQRWLTKNKMATVIIGQIHDSIIADVAEDEYDDYVAKVKELFEVALPRRWDWINVPMEVEIEAAPIGGSWHQKKKVA